MSDETREVDENAATMTNFTDEEEVETAFAQTIGAQLDGGALEQLTAQAGVQRYERRRMLGEGGMGRVMEANDRQFGRPVALKELRDDARGGLVARFQVEALVTANLEHPGIPPVYERGIDERGLPFYAMRLIRGTTLSEAMAEAQSLEERLKLLPVLVRTAQTVAFAHERGVVHRDIKPDNILLGVHGQTTSSSTPPCRQRRLATSSAGATCLPMAARRRSATSRRQRTSPPCRCCCGASPSAGWRARAEAAHLNLRPRSGRTTAAAVLGRC